MPRYHPGALVPPDDTALTLAAERYEESDAIVDDAIDWACDTRPQSVIDAALAEYRESERYRTAVEDIAAGERTVT